MDFTNIEESRPDGEQPLKFYYNREERLEKAPQVVQDFYSGKFKANKGIKAIFANKSNRFMLGTVAVLTAFVWLYQGVFAKKNTAVINDIKYELQAFSYADEVYSTIKISSKKSAVLKEPLNIDADVFVINADNQLEQKYRVKSVSNLVHDIMPYEFRLVSLGVCRDIFNDYGIKSITVHDAVYMREADKKRLDGAEGSANEYIARLFARRLGVGAVKSKPLF